MSVRAERCSVLLQASFRYTFHLVAFLLLAPPALAAQQIHGTVRDITTGAPVEGVLLVALNADSAVRATTLSNRAGGFRFHIVPGDSIRLYVQRLGYAAQRTVPIALQRGDTLELAIGLRPEPVTLQGVTVTAPINRNLERFLREKDMGFGRYLGPEDIARMDPKSTTQLLLRIPGSPLLPSTNGRKIMARVRGGPHCVPTVYVDGFILEEDVPSQGGRPHPLQDRGIPVESYVPAGSIRAVAVYPNPTNAPVEFQRAFMPDCPVVVIWTDYGFGFGTKSVTGFLREGSDGRDGREALSLARRVQPLKVRAAFEP